MRYIPIDGLRAPFDTAAAKVDERYCRGRVGTRLDETSDLDEPYICISNTSLRVLLSAEMQSERGGESRLSRGQAMSRRVLGL
eukprot:220839-Prorocentrum_minimum.AAC.2